jgi:hypothetical protein
MQERVRQSHLNRSDIVAEFTFDVEKNKAAHSCPPQMVNRIPTHAQVESRSRPCKAIAPLIETT